MPAAEPSRLRRSCRNPDEHIKIKGANYSKNTNHTILHVHICRNTSNFTSLSAGVFPVLGEIGEPARQTVFRDRSDYTHQIASRLLTGDE